MQITFLFLWDHWPRGGGGGAGEVARGGGGGAITSYIWHSTDVRAEWHPFSALSAI